MGNLDEIPIVIQQSLLEVMTPSTVLFDLVKSLTQAEKRYFRLYASRHVLNNQSLSLVLFDALKQQPRYDEQALKLRMQTHGSKPHNFASLKHSLQDMILQAMREFHRAARPHRQVRDLVEDAAFLHAKGLTAAGLKLLQKAKEKAVHYEAFDMQLYIAEVEIEYLAQRDRVLNVNHLRQFSQDADLAVTGLRTVNELKRLSFQLLYRARRNYSLRDQKEVMSIQEVAAHPVLHQQHTSFMGQYMVARVKATLAQLGGDFETSFQWRKEILALWAAFPQMQEAFPHLRGISIANYLAACHDTERYREMPVGIDQLRALKPSNPTESIEFQQNAAYYELLYCMNTCNWDRAVACVTDLEHILVHHLHGINKARLIAIWYNLANYHLFMGNNKAALAMVNAILNDEGSRHREDIQQATRLLQVVIHYELENIDILDHLLRGTKRYMQMKESMHAFEHHLIRTMSRLQGTASETDKHSRLSDLQKKLTALRADPENKDAPGLREIQCWLEAKLSKKRLRDTVCG